MKKINSTVLVLLLGLSPRFFAQEGGPSSHAIILEEDVSCYDAPSPSRKLIKILSIADVFPLEEQWLEPWIPLVTDMDGHESICFVHHRSIAPFDEDEPILAARTMIQHIMSLEEKSAEQMVAMYSALFEQDTRTDTAWENMTPEERDLLELELLAHLENFSQEDLAPSSRGTIEGVVIDQDNGITLPGATVHVLGIDHTTYTDIDGRYHMELPVGPYDIQVTMPGYAEQVVTIEVIGNRLLSMEVILDTNVFSEEIVVKAAPVESDSSTARAQMELRLSAPVMQDNIGADEMSSNDDSNVADAVRRVTGVSVVDGQSIFVRGLGERYSNMTLAGLTLPTTEPDRRIVPLDIFSTGLTDSVQVSKTYAPDKSPQFAGGLIDIIPKKLPERTSYEFSLGGNYNTLTTGQTGLSYRGGRPWNGFGRGARALPANFPDRKVIRGGRFTSDEIGFLQEDLERFGESFNNIWDPIPNRQPMNHSYSGLFGGRFGKWGGMVTAQHSQNSQITQEEQTFYKIGTGRNIEPFNGPYYFDETQFTSEFGSFGNIAYQFNPNHRLSFSNFYVHTGTDETRIFEGFNSDIDNNIRGQRLFFVEKQILSRFVSGDHLFPGISNSRFDWKLALTRADRHEPDLREVLYEFDPAREDFVLADESQSGSRQFNNLEDNSVEFNANWSALVLNWANLPTQIKFGTNYIDRRRGFLSRRFRFVPMTLRGLDLSRPAEDLFTQEHIGENFQLKEETRSTDQYDGFQDITSAYGMIDLPFSDRLRSIFGVRFEGFSQQVDTYDPFARSIFGDDVEIIRANVNKMNTFPAVNLVYSARPNQNLRMSIGQTVNRPEFRELAPFEFTDIVGGRTMIGNPHLQQSLIQNVDARWELFPGDRGDEVIAASVFYKNFHNPIERIVEPTAQLRTSFTNAHSAQNMGFELEGRKAFGRHLFTGINYSHITSRVMLDAASRQVQTSLVRPLAGTSSNLLNAMFEVRGQSYSTRLLWNFYGDRISDVGSLGLPDIIQEGRHGLDFILSKQFRPNASFKFSITNLTDGAYIFSQGGRVHRIYNLGRGASVGLTLRP